MFGGLRVRAARVGLVSLFALASAARGASAGSAVPPADGGVAGAEEPAAPDLPTYSTVVTATRNPRPGRDVPATVLVLPREAVEMSPALTMDDLLRQLPSLQTFRRTTSLTADPTSQGLSIRGVGPSGVSRSLVLWDGIPLNDPFGGWVYWRQLSRLGVDRVEVVPGGGSAQYGSSALGGVAQIFSRPIEGPEAEALAEGGLYRTGLLAARGTDRWGPVGAELLAEGLTTEGYPVVAPQERGPIDGPTPTAHGNVTGRVEADVGDAVHLLGRAGYFHEYENGGTRFTTAGVDLLTWGLTALARTARQGSLSVVLYGHSEDFTQDRARVAPGRSSEQLSSHQDVPSGDQGASAVWTSAPLRGAGLHTLSGGVEGHRVQGAADADLFPAVLKPTSTVVRDSGGQQLLGRAFVQELYQPVAAVELLGALAWDGWRNQHGFVETLSSSGSSRTSAYPDESAHALSPRVAGRWSVRDWLTFRASWAQAFRAPTLDELYRPFQVGTIVTAANPALGPERLNGGEVGFDLLPKAPVALRCAGFFNRLLSPVTNVTLPAPLPDGSQRIRENLGEARINGVEALFDWRWARAWSLSLAYTLAGSRVTVAPGHPALVGKQLAQDPLHRATAVLSFLDPRIVTADVEVRWLGPQFEDDLNTLPMAGYVQVDAFVQRHLASFLDAFLSVQNLFDHRAVVSRAGVDLLGPPFLAQVGLKARAPF